MGHYSLALVASSQQCRQKAKTLPNKKEPGPPRTPETHFPPMTSIVKRSASCTVSGWPCRVGMGVLSANHSQCQDTPQPQQACSLSSQAPRGSQALPHLYLGQLDGFIELVQGTLEVCDLRGTETSPSFPAWTLLLLPPQPPPSLCGHQVTHQKTRS